LRLVSTLVGLVSILPGLPGEAPLSCPGRVERAPLRETRLTIYSNFNSWRRVPLRCKGTRQYPIPEDWYRIGQRQSLDIRKKEKSFRVPPGQRNFRLCLCDSIE